MDWILDEAGNVVTRNGKPLYKDAQGNETEYDAERAFSKIANLRRESADSRKRYETAEASLAEFGEVDATSAIDAVSRLRDIDDSSLIDADKLDEMRSRMKEDHDLEVTRLTEAHDSRFKDLTATNDALQTQMHTAILSSAFRRSKYIADTIDSPADFVEPFFRDNFKVEDVNGVPTAVGYHGEGRIYAKNGDGNQLAGFDEALKYIVDRYENRDAILKGPMSGSGSRGNQSSTSGVLTQAAWDAKWQKADVATKEQLFKDLSSGAITVAAAK